MPFKSTTLSEYEEASGLQRGQLWKCLTEAEQQRLIRLGYRPRCRLPNGALDYLMEIFPLPDHQTELVSLTVYEKRCGFSECELKRLLTEEELRKFQELGYRRNCIIPYRAVLYLRSLGYY